jgi:hypothetical protein
MERGFVLLSFKWSARWFARSTVYFDLVLGVVNTLCEGTIILLIDRLTNVNSIAVIVAVVMMVVSPCETLLWYHKDDCR